MLGLIYLSWERRAGLTLLIHSCGSGSLGSPNSVLWSLSHALLCIYHFTSVIFYYKIEKLNTVHSGHQLMFKALSEGAVKSSRSVKPRQLPLNLSVAAQRTNLEQTAHGVILNISWSRAEFCRLWKLHGSLEKRHQSEIGVSGNGLLSLHSTDFKPVLSRSCCIRGKILILHGFS